MFNFNGIDHLNIRVNNLKESLKFSNIGLSNKAMLCMYETPELTHDSLNLGHIGFNIDFKEDMEIYLKENGVKINYYGDSAVINYPKSKSIYIEDPSGYEIELTSNFGGGL